MRPKGARQDGAPQRDRPETRPVGGIGTTGAQRRFDLGEEDPQHRIHQTRVALEEVAQPLRQRQDPLPHRHLGKDVIHQVSGGLGHPPGGARRADAPPLAGESDQEVMATVRAARPSKTVGENAAGEVLAEVVLDVRRDRLTVRIAAAGLLQPGFQVALHHL